MFQLYKCFRIFGTRQRSSLIISHIESRVNSFYTITICADDVHGVTDILNEVNGFRKLIAPTSAAADGRTCLLTRFRGSQHWRFVPAPHLHISGARAAGTVAFKLADIGEGIKEVTIKEWFIKEGDRVSQFDELCEVQSDKASVTITSRYDGVIKKIHHEVDQIAQVGQALVDIEVEDSQDAGSSQKLPNKEAEAPSKDPEKIDTRVSSYNVKAIATPAVRRIAGEHKVKLADVQGTGKDGRVLKEDVVNYINAKQGTPGTERVFDATAPSTSVVVKTKGRESRVEPMKGYTKAMVKSMTIANEIPHFGYCDEVDASALITLRDQLKKLAKSSGIKLTYMPFFIKAASVALDQYPILNSSVDLDAGTIIYKGSHNIGVAMDTKLGLIVPNIKNVEQLNILEIAEELKRLHESGLKGSIKPEDMTGGTFTLSNIGAIGGTYASPVILPPEVAIGAIGKFQVLPRFDSAGNVARATIFNVSWSADHRVIDGATMSRFSNLWKSFLENPATLLMHLK